MAQGDVTMVFSAEDAEFIQKCQSARSAIEAMGLQARQAGQRAAGAGEQFLEFSKKVEETVLEIAGIGGAIETASRIWDDRIEDMKQRAEAATQTVLRLEDALSKNGKIAMLPQVRSMIAGISPQANMSQEALEGVYGKISTVPGLTDEGAAMAMQSVATARSMGFTQEGAGQFGQTFAGLQAAGASNPMIAAMNQRQLEIATQTLMQVFPEGLADQDFAAIAASNDPNTAIDAVVATRKARLSAKKALPLVQESGTAVTLAERLAAQKEQNTQSGHAVLALDAAQKAYAAGTGPDPLQAMIDNPEVFGRSDEEIATLQAIKKNYGPAFESSLSSDSVLGQQKAFVALKQQSPLVAGADLQEMADAKAKNALRTPDALEAQEFQAVSDYDVAKYRSQGYGPGMAGFMEGLDYAGYVAWPNPSQTHFVKVWTEMLKEQRKGNQIAQDGNTIAAGGATANGSQNAGSQ